jgi:hypothetical protein
VDPQIPMMQRVTMRAIVVGVSFDKNFIEESKY